MAQLRTHYGKVCIAIMTWTQILRNRLGYLVWNYAEIGKVIDIACFVFRLCPQDHMGQRYCPCGK
eukprot:2293165-Amphidinium_carterae.1